MGSEAVETRTLGTTMPVLEVSLGPGEKLTAEGGEVAWYTPGMQLETSTRFGSGGKGGFMSGLKRALGGGQLFLTEYADEFMVQSGSYVASTTDVEVSVALQKKMGAGVFGGAGLVFQKLAGNGTAWVQLSGEIVEYDLPPGGSMIVHPGHLALFTTGMDLQFATVKGVRNKFFGDSLTMAQIHGPGHIWLQSMTPAKLAAAIEPYLPDKSGGGNGDN
jgi:uncharacterized protein (AIM24 family)